MVSFPDSALMAAVKAAVGSLRVLDLAGNAIADVGPLSGLDSLWFVDLTGDPLLASSVGLLDTLSARSVSVDYGSVAGGDSGPIEGEGQPPGDAVMAPFTFAFLGESNIGHRWNIWLGFSDGSPPRPLVDEPADFVEYDWSPDGTRTVFSSNREDFGRQPFRTYVYRLGNPEPTAITDFYQHHLGLTWSPDGQQIAYVAAATNQCRCGKAEIMDAAGTEVRRLTNGSDGDDGPPVWSPDGGRIAVIRNPGGASWLSRCRPAPGPRWPITPSSTSAWSGHRPVMPGCTRCRI